MSPIFRPFHAWPRPKAADADAETPAEAPEVPIEDLGVDAEEWSVA